MCKIREVTVLDNYCLSLCFDDGIRGTVDLSGSVGRGVFAFWQDYNSFKQVTIGSSGELVWNNQVDVVEGKPIFLCCFYD